MNTIEATALACSNDYERGKRDAKEFYEVQYVAGEWIGRQIDDDAADGIRRAWDEILEFVSGDYLDGLAAGGCAVLEPIARVAA